MLIGSEITYGDALSILYEVRDKGNHADRDKVLLKKSCHEITLPAAKARFAQVLRNSPLAMPLTGSNLPHSVVEECIIHRVFPLTLIFYQFICGS